MLQFRKKPTLARRSPRWLLALTLPAAIAGLMLGPVVSAHAAVGTLHVLRLVTAFDCGAVIDPANLASQVEGATVMGLGGALFEQVDFADGVIRNASLSQYRVPRLPDVPPVAAILIDRPDQPSAGGGETPLIAVAPALANAIRAAAGIRLRSLPLAPSGKISRA